MVLRAFESVWLRLAAFDIFFKMRLPTSEVDNFSLKMSWNILKYTGTIYSTRSLQIRGVFEVKVIHFRAGGANSHTCCGESVRIRKTEISEQIWNFWPLEISECDCLHLLRENISLSLQKLPGFEEISSSRWSLYILKCFNSYSMKSYRPLKLECHFEKYAIRRHEPSKPCHEIRNPAKKPGDLSTLKKYETISSVFLHAESIYDV